MRTRPADGEARAGRGLATLLARTSTSANADLSRRLEAAAAFDPGLRRDAGGRGVGGRVTRGVSELLGLRRAEDQSLEWEIERPARGALAAEVLSLTVPEQEGDYRIGITVTDLASARTATSERVIRVGRSER